METLIVGATGGTGAQVYRALMAGGASSVRCFVRDASKAAELLGKTATVTVGNVLDAESVSAAMAGVRTLVIASGPVRRDVENDSQRVDFEGTRNLLKAAHAAGSVRRVVLVSSYGTEEPLFWFGCLLNFVAKNVLGWKLKAEQLVRESGIPYAIIRPTSLRNDGEAEPRTPIVEACVPYMWGASQVSRTNVGRLCAHIVQRSSLPSPGITVAIRDGNAREGNSFDWHAAVSAFPGDTGPLMATFGDHVNGVRTAIKVLKAVACVAILGLAYAAWSHFG